jgi:hypothetical protein
VNEPTEQKRGIDTLSPHPRNYNQHPPAQITRIAKSLVRFGQVKPIVVHRNTIIAGHGVYMAAQHLGYQTLRVTQLPDDWTDEQAMAYLVADNETRRGAESSDAELAALLDELQQADFDLDSLGFDEAEYDALLDGLTSGDLPEKLLNGQVSHGYGFGDINPQKLAYRVEAAWAAADGVAVELFAGESQLSYWYRRRFSSLVRVDQNDNLEPDITTSANGYLMSHFQDVSPDFAFIDLDDEGSPLREVETLFSVLPNDRASPFVLCITDGSGLNLKMRGKIDPSLYGLSGATRQATQDDYEYFEQLVSRAVQHHASSWGWAAMQLSSVRGSDGNVVYQTFRVERVAQPLQEPNRDAV